MDKFGQGLRFVHGRNSGFKVYKLTTLIFGYMTRVKNGRVRVTTVPYRLSYITSYTLGTQYHNTMSFYRNKMGRLYGQTRRFKVICTGLCYHTRMLVTLGIHQRTSLTRGVQCGGVGVHTLIQRTLTFPGKGPLGSLYGKNNKGKLGGVVVYTHLRCFLLRLNTIYKEGGGRGQLFLFTLQWDLGRVYTIYAKRGGIRRRNVMTLTLRSLRGFFSILFARLNDGTANLGLYLTLFTRFSILSGRRVRLLLRFIGLLVVYWSCFAVGFRGVR